VDVDALVNVVSGHRAAGRRTVFTNGCFDVLHAGHVRYLQQARALGDVLVVGLNSDESVQRLKGRGRPVNPQDDRCTVLAALACVDHVVVFGEDTPVRLVARLRPEVYVKGGDYDAACLPEARVVEGYGGQVRILPYLDGRSTTALLNRIGRLTGAGSPHPRT
jgi:D-beta-D-heptose 7-phosphate kinase / D-beta-D-heptose 1-phosphate adenosyltransferase